MPVAEDRPTIPVTDRVPRRMGAVQNLTRCRAPRAGIAPAGRGAIV